MAYATVGELRSHLGLSVTTDTDEWAEVCLDAVSAAVDEHCGRTFVPDPDASVSTRTFASLGTSTLLVDDHVESATLIETSPDGTIWTEYTGTVLGTPATAGAWQRPYTGIKAVGGVWPTGLVRVTAIWGWERTPKQVKPAVLLKAARLYKRKDTPTGIEGFGEFVVRINRQEDGDVIGLLAPLVRTDRTFGMA